MALEEDGEVRPSIAVGVTLDQSVSAAEPEAQFAGLAREGVGSNKFKALVAYNIELRIYHTEVKSIAFGNIKVLDHAAASDHGVVSGPPIEGIPTDAASQRVIAVAARLGAAGIDDDVDEIGRSSSVLMSLIERVGRALRPPPECPHLTMGR